MRLVALAAAMALAFLAGRLWERTVVARMLARVLAEVQRQEAEQQELRVEEALTRSAWRQAALN